MRYFVKSRFYGWREVDKDSYDRFIKNIRDNATGIKQEDKEKFIKTVTKTEGGGNTAHNIKLKEI